jgi:hypothetical protein
VITYQINHKKKILRGGERKDEGAEIKVTKRTANDEKGEKI